MAQWQGGTIEQQYRALTEKYETTRQVRFGTGREMSLHTDTKLQTKLV